MRSLDLVLIIALASALALFACKDADDAEAYPDLQDCFDDHHNVEALSVQESIVVCCTDHPIAGVKPACRTTEAACETFVNAELDDTITTSMIATACTEYVSQMNM